mmetsp:Transcript_45358/g.129461  ORF Transcript_45358/g.129461 Transcript_45358/m.129461 type:complete len:269 (-) Transcript_45358:220-1026(-)
MIASNGTKTTTAKSVAMPPPPPRVMEPSDARMEGMKSRTSRMMACCRLKRSSRGSSRLLAKTVYAMKRISDPKGTALIRPLGTERIAKIGPRAGTTCSSGRPKGSESTSGSKYARHATSRVPKLRSSFSPTLTSRSGSRARRSSASRWRWRAAARSAARLSAASASISRWRSGDASSAKVRVSPCPRASSLSSCSPESSRPSASFSRGPSSARPRAFSSPRSSRARAKRRSSALWRSSSSASARNCAASSSSFAASSAARASSSSCSS